MNIDAVITWVDGSDPDFISSKEKYKTRELKKNKNVLEIGLLKTRFDSVGEVLYCIKLIRKNIPWVNNIFLLTNGQTPKFLTEEFKEKFGVILVTHYQVFGKYHKLLPVFNSRSIEAMLPEIPGISEDFLYFNDDVFVINYMKYEDFKLNNKYVFRGIMRFKNIWIDRLHRVTRFNYVRGTVGKREESNQYPSKLMYFTPIHGPYLINKNLYKEAIDVHGGYQSIIKYKFRNKDQPWPIGLYINHLADKNLLYRVSGKDCGYYHGEKDNVFDTVKFKDLKFISAQSLDSLPIKKLDKVFKFLDS